MLAVITLFAMLMVEDADAEQAVNHTGNTRSPDASLDYWTGRIEQDTTWRDTVYVGGDVTIASGATLTLAPDTQVHFLPYRDDTQGGLDSTRAELIVEGRLNAQAEGIVFCSANAASLGADWYGIVVKRGGIADVSNATIRDGLRCLYAKIGGRVTMDHIAFANCGKPTGASLSQRSAASASDSTQVDAHLVVDGLRATPDNLVESREFMLGEFLNNRAVTRIPIKVGVGALTMAVLFYGYVAVIEEPEESEGIGLWVAAYGSFFFGYPLGIHLVDMKESSFRLTLIGNGLGMWGSAKLLDSPNPSERAEGAAWVTLLGAPVLASELSRMDAVTGGPKRPKQSQDLRFSVGLVPQPHRGLSAVATLRF